MPLAMEGPRPLSPLEREAFRLVFWDSIDPCDVYVSVFDDIYREGGYYSGAGSIQINRSTFLDANLHMNSTHANTDILKPANIRCLSTLIHESTHHWQWTHKKYTDAGPYRPVPYDFSFEELQKLKFMKEYHEFDPLLPSEKPLPEGHELLKEQHAAAAQVYFVIAWQLEHSSDRLVNLTEGATGKNIVGPVERYHRIHAIPDAHPLDPVPPAHPFNPAPPGRRVSRQYAIDIANDFNVYLVDLRSGGQKQWAG